LAGQAAKEGRLAGLQGLHGMDVGATQHQDDPSLFECLIPGVLERGEHSRVRINGIGELVQDEDVPPLAYRNGGGTAQDGGDGRPALGPGAKGGSLARFDVQDAGVELAALQSSGFLFGSPIGVRYARVLGPMAKQNRFAHTPTAEEENELGSRGAVALQDRIQESQFGLAIDEHRSSLPG